jgi:putative thioredoxin
MAIDVTDATFQTDVIDKSSTVPVVVDLWAPWCGPCRTLGPIIEKAVDATEGKVVLTKVNVDENPQISGMFRVQSIPAVYAMRNGQVVDGFLGALPERDVERFVEGLLPTEEQTTLAALLAAGDELSLRKALQLEPGNEDVVIALATLLVGQKQFEEALALLERIPESERTRPIAAAARLGDPQAGEPQAGEAQAGEAPSDDYDATLLDLLPRVKDDDDARQQYVDILEVMGIDDPRTADYRKKLSRELF